MALSELFEIEKREKLIEVSNQIKDRINKVGKGEFLDAIEYNRMQIVKEIHKLFSQKNDPTDKYHWIENFSFELIALKGAPYSFEEKLELIKKKALLDYQDHDYLPKIKKFLLQTDEDIVKKLAHYAAYSEIQILLSMGDKTTLRKFINKMPSIGITSLNYSKDSEFQFRNLFRTENAYVQAKKTINEYFLDENGLWIGYNGKRQEIPALVEFLLKNNYITCKSFTATVRIFCKRFDVEISDRTARSKGFAYDDAIKHYQKVFKKI